jgi:cupin fold WbuC family metalloprotein
VKKFNEIAPNILSSTSNSLVIDPMELEDLKKRATASPLQRSRILAHGTPDAPLHEMLIVQTAAVYVRPHRHHGKSESLHVIEGAAKIVYFDNDGGIEDCVDVGPPQSGKPFYLRNDSPRWHTQIILSPFFVFHEVTNGPFRRTDTEFAPWSPEEDDLIAAAAFFRTLLEKLGIAPSTAK